MRKRPTEYRPCVGAFIINQEGLVFIGRRIGTSEHVDKDYAWQMPQGGIDQGETPIAALEREMYEETSIKNFEIIAEAKQWHSYDLPNQNLARNWKGKYCGQNQKWFAVKFTGDDSEINIDQPGGGKHRPEFSQWRWAKASSVPNVIIPFKRDIYYKILDEFRGLYADDTK